MIYSCHLFSLVILDTGQKLFSDKILGGCKLPFIIMGKECSANVGLGKMMWELLKAAQVCGMLEPMEGARDHSTHLTQSETQHWIQS